MWVTPQLFYFKLDVDRHIRVFPGEWRAKDLEVFLRFPQNLRVSQTPATHLSDKDSEQQQVLEALATLALGWINLMKLPGMTRLLFWNSKPRGFSRGWCSTPMWPLEVRRGAVTDWVEQRQIGGTWDRKPGASTWLWEKRKWKFVWGTWEDMYACFLLNADHPSSSRRRSQ